MIVTLASLLLAAMPVSPQVNRVSAVPERASTAVTRMRAHPPVMRYDALRAVVPTLREATLCSVHMELLVERLSATEIDIPASVWQIQDYWQGQLPDPDGADAVPDEIIDQVKTALVNASKNEPEGYQRQLQACVDEAGLSGALD